MYLKRLFRPLLLIVMLVTLVASLYSPHLLQAQSGGQGLEIKPPLIDLKADPGQTLKTQIRLRNVTTGTLIARAHYQDFVAGGEEGQPRLLQEGDEASPYSIKEWLSSVPAITLGPQEEKVIDLSIRVPDNASPGGHYGVIRFQGAPPELDDTAVSLSASIGTLILVNVSGDVKEDATIKELFASQNGQKRKIMEYGPVTITARIENKGSVHIQPSGVIRVTNMFGKQVAFFQVNQNKGNVLPASVRKFEQNLDKRLLFGRYSINADLVYGTENKIITSTATFWVIPYKLILIGIAVIVILVFMIRRYNRLVVSRAHRRANGGKKTSRH